MCPGCCCLHEVHIVQYLLFSPLFLPPFSPSSLSLLSLAPFSLSFLSLLSLSPFSLSFLSLSFLSLLSLLPLSLLTSFSYPYPPSISLFLFFSILLFLFSSLSQPLSARDHVEKGTPEAILDHIVRVHSANSDNGTICASRPRLRTRLDMYMTMSAHRVMFTTKRTPLNVRKLGYLIRTLDWTPLFYEYMSWDTSSRGS